MSGRRPLCGCPSVAECGCTERRCNQCGKNKPVGDFPPDKPGSNSSVRSNKCLECKRLLDRQYVEANKDLVASRQASYYQENKEQAKAYGAQYREANRERLRSYNRNRQQDPDYQRKQFGWHLQRKYGITVEDYESILDSQQGGCAICGKDHSGDPRRPRLHVDHCHQSGEVRGLLCSDCNRALGQFGDNPERLENAARYMRKYLSTKGPT